jgi:hypothetical protein
MKRDRLHYLLIPLAAFIAILPLILHGCSCGHDFDFHLLNWLEAAHQFSHGNLHPHWAYTPAYNAGEPRFVFYPPFSWTIGAILSLIFPLTATPIIYTWLALTASGLALYYLARDFAPPTAALLAATLYTVNPYMLFTAYERTAYAELLAAAWIPLLLHAILRNKITIPRIAIPVALLWLTNAPAAVMSCYALALLTILRLTLALRTKTNNEPSQTVSTPSPSEEPSNSEKSSFSEEPSKDLGGPSNLGGPSFAVSSQRVGYSRHARSALSSIPTSTARQSPIQLATTTVAGTLLGLSLAAFYIIPAAYERRYVQIAMAIIPNMRIQDNFLFHHTGDIPHDHVLHTASLIAATLIAATTITLTTLQLAKKKQAPNPSRSHPEGWYPQIAKSLLLPLTVLTIAITLLLTPLTAFIWNHAPELAFLQFPWRLVAILAAVLALAIALALAPINWKKPTTRAAAAIAVAAALTYPAYSAFHQSCDEEDTPHAREALFHSNQGTDPTDEYTPLTADNDSLVHDDPAFWLSTNPDAKAPTTTQPNPTPNHLRLNAPVPEDLILNLRDYPSWHITLNGSPATTHEERDDGLIAIPIPAGASTIDITYAYTLDQTIGDAISVLSLALLLFTLYRKPGQAPATP